MPCYKPLDAWSSTCLKPNGKRHVVFSELPPTPQYERIQIPCGQCIGCRLERSRQWALRCMHEASMHEDNSFVTLTYNDDNLPPTGSLVKSDFQKFMKRLRRRVEPLQIRYYMCGEYGENPEEPNNLGRPHYHAILFGFRPTDLELHAVTDRDDKLFTSDFLSDVWGKGYVIIGDVTFESCAYVARYVAKKITGQQADHHYMKLDYNTGELYPVLPEYNDMSRRSAIGNAWFKEFYRDLEKDFITARGVKMKPPRYYDKLFEGLHPEKFSAIKEERKLKSWEQFEDNSPDRLRVKEQVKRNRIKLLKRKLT